MELDKGDNGGGSGKHGPREERSRQQREQRDRHHRAKQHRTRDGDRKESRQKPRSNRTLDIIDKLDITGVYGSARKCLEFLTPLPFADLSLVSKRGFLFSVVRHQFLWRQSFTCYVKSHL